ncbi:MAG: carbamate kinase [Candidatus Marsarchaeota archaeon]|nr:carbamate kinase [Candidatus Marsarchaeota archaeon]
MDRIVIALGGNALMNPSGSQDVLNERLNMDRIALDLIRLSKFYEIAITHGNGTQVGDEINRNEHAKSEVPKMPLYLLNAETQASIGSIIELSLKNAANKLKIKSNISVVLAHVHVNKDDSAFKNPLKQVGPFYTKKELYNELKIAKFDYIKFNDKYRMVVPSPKPNGILEITAIKSLIKKNIIITCGGGGIPVVYKNKSFNGISAVIDKDRTSQLLANSIGANKLIILTNAEFVYSNYNDKKSAIKSIKAFDIAKNLDSFENGTIKPKIESCINFIANGGSAAYIGNIFKLNEILKGKSGTMIY